MKLFELNTNGLFYKYRDLKNFAHFADIIIKQRLYAAEFKKLNDPMEGLYLDKFGRLSSEFKKELKDGKYKTRICSLSTNRKCSLMWTHYADEHRGVVIEFSVKENNDFTFEKIRYIEGIQSIEDIATPFDKLTPYRFLSSKLKSWEAEGEVRLFTKALENRLSYIKVDIKKIYAGVKMSKSEFKVLETFVKKCNSNIVVERIKRSDLI